MVGISVLLGKSKACWVIPDGKRTTRRITVKTIVTPSMRPRMVRKGPRVRWMRKKMNIRRYSNITKRWDKRQPRTNLLIHKKILGNVHNRAAADFVYANWSSGTKNRNKQHTVKVKTMASSNQKNVKCAMTFPNDAPKKRLSSTVWNGIEWITLLR